MRDVNDAISPLRQQVAEAIRRRIRRGSYGERLPGMRVISRELGVSRSMVAEAIGLLKNSGEIDASGERKRMRPVLHKVKRRAAGFLIVHDIFPGASIGETRHMLDLFKSRLPGPVTELPLSPEMPPARILDRVRRVEAGTILVMNHGVATVDLLKDSGLHVIAIGSMAMGTRAPVIATHFEKMVGDAFRAAFAAGHRRVVLPIVNRPPAVAARMRGWVAEAYAAAGLRHSPDFDAPIIEGASPEIIAGGIRELFRYTPPSALIIHTISLWLGGIAVFSRLRLRVPEDVSTILLGRFPGMECYLPSQDHFRWPAEDIVAEIRKLTRTGAKTEGVVRLIDAIHEPGGSLGPPSR